MRVIYFAIRFGGVTTKSVTMLFATITTLFLVGMGREARAAFYPYYFENGTVLVIGTGFSDTTTPSLYPGEDFREARRARDFGTSASFISEIQDSTPAVQNEKLRKTHGFGNFYRIHPDAVTDIILFDYDLDSLNEGHEVGMQVMRFERFLPRTFDWQQVVILGQRNFNLISMDLKIVLAGGLVFAVEIENQGLPLTRNGFSEMPLRELIQDIRIHGGFIEGQRAILAVSVKSPLGDRTILTSTNLSRGHHTRNVRNENQSRYFTHYEITQFAPNLQLITQAGSSSGTLAVALSEDGVSPMRGTHWGTIMTHSQSQKSATSNHNSVNDSNSTSTVGGLPGAASSNSGSTLPVTISRPPPAPKKDLYDDFRLGIEEDPRGTQYHYIERLSDGKKVYIHVGTFDNPTMTIDARGIAKVEGMERRVSLTDFDFESTYRLHVALEKVQGSNDRPSEVVAQAFPPWVPKLNDQFYFSEQDHSLVDEMRTQVQNQDIKSFVILGEPGSGKTIIMGEFLKSLPPTWDVFMLDRSALEAGTSLRGQLEVRIQAMIHLARQRPIVLFVDELHGLKGAGGDHRGGLADIINMLKTPLASGEIIIVGTDTKEEFQEAFGADDAFKRRVKTIEMKEPTEKDLLRKLEVRAKGLGFSHIHQDFLEMLIKVGAKALPQYHEPFRSSSILDQVSAYIGTDLATRKRTSFDKNLLKTVLGRMTRLRFDRAEIQALITKAEKEYRKQIVGADPIMPKLFKQTIIGWAGLYSGKGPMVRMLMSGPAGVGKSERGMAYANAMGLPHIFVSPSMFGRNPESVIQKVAEALEKDPFTVIILDEVEKYPDSIRNVFLNLLSNNVLTVQTDDHHGKVKIRRVYTRFATVIATTNAGEDVFQSSQRSIGFVQGESHTSKQGSQQDLKAIQLQDILKARIDPYFVDRFPAETALARVDKPDRDEMRRILLLRASEKFRQAKAGNILEIDITIPQVAALVDEVLNIAWERGYQIRNAEGLLYKRIDDRWMNQVAEISAPKEKRKRQDQLVGAAAKSCQALFQ